MTLALCASCGGALGISEGMFLGGLCLSCDAPPCDCRNQTSHFDKRTMIATCLTCGRERPIVAPTPPTPHTEGTR